MPELCPICEGSGLRLVDRPDGTRIAEDCVCRLARRAERQIAQARIPQQFANCTFENFDPRVASAGRSLEVALLSARQFVNAYPLETDGKGLLLIGRIGVGKTHLAVATLKALVTERGAKGLFYDCATLFKELQNTYDKTVRLSEREILKPVLESDVLVLDEVGASRTSEWVGDTIAHIINTRYNNRRTTIVTTNLENLPPLGAVLRDTWSAPREDTLGDRIGERMRSRLQEMCIVVEMHGKDLRQTSKRANFAANLQRDAVMHALGSLPEEGESSPRTAFEQGASAQEKNQQELLVGRKRLGKFASSSQPPSVRNED